MALIVDASIAAAWVLVDEQNNKADAIMFGLDATPALVPVLFWFEALNLCLLAERRGRIGVWGALIAMARLRRLNLKDLDIDGDRAILSIALKHNLSAYDAAYLALAIDQSLPLATNDRKLAAAARAEAVKILGPLNNAL